MNKTAIDLSWVRHQKMGGTESFVRNLLDGIASVATAEQSFVLLLAKDNADSFEKYRNMPCFAFEICQTVSENQKKRVIWQNTRMGKLLRKKGITVCLEPIYGMPFFGTRGIKFVTIIHDLQAKHYPQYFSRCRVAWMHFSWYNTVKRAARVVAISQYVKNDILSAYRVPENKLRVIYNPVSLDYTDCAKAEKLSDFHLKAGEYYYTVSSLHPHKNLETLISAIAELKNKASPAFYPLVISGIAGKRAGLDALIRQYGLTGDVIFTSFVSNGERNMLYRHCRAFLFGSIFEGFGMPPIEAAAFGVPVLLTQCSCIPEVTGGLLNYLENPLDSREWAYRLEQPLTLPTAAQTQELLKKYDKAAVARQYISLLKELQPVAENGY